VSKQWAHPCWSDAPWQKPMSLALSSTIVVWPWAREGWPGHNDVPFIAYFDNQNLTLAQVN
jgi:hypothetical protein